MYEMIEGTSLVALDGGKKIREWRPVHWRSLNRSIKEVDRKRNLVCMKRRVNVSYRGGGRVCVRGRGQLLQAKHKGP